MASYLGSFFIFFVFFVVISSYPLIDAHHNHTFKLSLIHRDFSNQTLTTKLQKWKSALERSNRRFEYLKEFIDTKVGAEDATGSYEAPVWSNLGSYLTTLTIGTPGRTFRAIVDTGSDLVWQQCEVCIFCYTQQDPIFEPSKSSTYTKASCQSSLCLALPSYLCLPKCVYSYSYGDKSRTMGDLSFDTLTLTDISGESVRINEFGFGCSHNARGDFGGASGLVGFGRGPLSLVSQLSIQKFSYCLVSLDDSRSQTSPLFLGDAAAEMFSKLPDIQSTPLLTNPRLLMQIFYYIEVTGISVGGERLRILPSVFQIQKDGRGGVIADSGTTLTYFHESIYNVVREAFETQITDLPRGDGADVGLDLCYEMFGEVPSLILHLGGSAKLELPVENYFVDTGDLFCLAIAKANSDLSILGNIAQQNFHILYDLANEMITFAPTTCDEL